MGGKLGAGNKETRETAAPDTLMHAPGAARSNVLCTPLTLPLGPRCFPCCVLRTLQLRELLGVCGHGRP